MAKELIINASLPETRIAMLEDGTIQELLIERDNERGIVGNIYKGKVTRVLPGMQAAFVDIGLEKAAFLYVDDIFVHEKVMGDDTDVDSENEAQSDENQSEEAQADASSQNESEEYGQSSEQENQNAEFDGNSDQYSQEESAELVNEEGQSDYAESQSDEGQAEFEGQGDSDENLDEAQAYEASADENGEDENGEDNRNEDNAETYAASSESSESNEDLDGNSDFQESQDFQENQDQEDNQQLQEGQESTAEEFQDPSLDTSTIEVSGSLEGLSQAPKPRNLGKGSGNRKGRGGRFNKNRRGGRKQHRFPQDSEQLPDSVTETMGDDGAVGSDRASLDSEVGMKRIARTGKQQGRGGQQGRGRPEFREQRGRDRRIKSKPMRQRANANIADLLQEGQEVIVQVAKDPIATKGARLTCHVSLAGRHIVCMPTINHVGVSRRIERDDERRRLRDFVEKNRNSNMGFIVRTASSGKDTEAWIKQDIQYLSDLWHTIRDRADTSQAPALVYEDLTPILRAIRDWVNEDISKIIIDSRYHYNELMEFAQRFMPGLSDKVELYQGDIPIFDAYGISSELHRSLERRVWLKSGGYIMIDQAEALVAIDVNTGRYVGKRSLEDTILKTNLEAAEEIAYQLRLRNCGGIIIVDFIDMEKDENRTRVYKALDMALRKDRARPTIQKISDLGLVEMTRKRTRDTMVRALCESCTHCEGKGFIKSQKTVAYEILREIERLGVDRDSKKILVSAHSDVIDILAIEMRDTLDALERRYHKQVYLSTQSEFHSEQYEVVTDRSQQKKFQQQDIARQMRVDRDRQERRERFKLQKRERPMQDDDSASEQMMTESAPIEQEDVQPAEFVATEEPVGETYAEVDPDSVGNSIQAPRRANEEITDEDQLAYLRAQAAQDAALARTAGSAAGMGAPTHQQNRFRRNNHRNNNNNNRNNNRRNHRGGRFRPRGGGGGGGGPAPGNE